MNNEASPNPYATPRAVVADPGASEVESVCKEHITHEASVKSAGALFMLGGLVTLAAVASLVIPEMVVAGIGRFSSSACRSPGWASRPEPGRL